MENPQLLVEFLYAEDCPNRYAALKILERTLRDASRPYRLEKILVASEEEAERLRFVGSPSIRVNGLDVEPNASDTEFSLAPRLYITREGFRGHPSAELILAAIESSRTLAS